MKMMNMVLGAMLLVALPAKALDALEKLFVTESVTINAPAEEVWKRAIGFDGLATWIPGITKNELVSGKANEPGAVRKLYVDNATMSEELMTVDNDTMTMTYRIVEENVDLLPVTHYRGSISVTPEGDKACKVTWSGDFYRGYPESNPPEYLTDAASVKGVKGFFTASLKHLKEEFEGKQ